MSIGIHGFPITKKAIETARAYLDIRKAGIKRIRMGQEFIGTLAPNGIDYR